MPTLAPSLRPSGVVEELSEAGLAMEGDVVAGANPVVPEDVVEDTGRDVA